MTLRNHTVATAPKTIQNMAIVAVMLAAGYTPETISTAFAEWEDDGREALPDGLFPVSVSIGGLPPVVFGADGATVGGTPQSTLADHDPETGDVLGETVWGGDDDHSDGRYAAGGESDEDLIDELLASGRETDDGERFDDPGMGD